MHNGVSKLITSFISYPFVLAHTMAKRFYASLRVLFSLINWPHVLQKARSEIDSVCDEDTLPSFKDWDSLRYVRMGELRSFQLASHTLT